ncbi:uncharacterized protein METZ01_LOCUS376119 [marine metagenome]|uniref:Uncharacterized protein n=1 Tax=marine metagenome TaxID=408172 RepID=A0A382TNB2_9ZZZZ
MLYGSPDSVQYPNQDYAQAISIRVSNVVTILDPRRSDSQSNAWTMISLLKKTQPIDTNKKVLPTKRRFLPECATGWPGRSARCRSDGRHGRELVDYTTLHRFLA